MECRSQAQVCNSVCQQSLSVLKGHSDFSWVSTQYELGPLSSHKLSLSPQLYIIWLHNTMSVSCSSNTSMPCLHPCLSNAVVSQLAAELRQFLVPCVKCVLKMPLPVGVWATLLSGVGDARQLERLRVVMCGKPVSIVWSLHIVGVFDVMTLNAVLVCRGLVQSGTTLTSQHWRRWRSHGHTAVVGKWSLTFQ